MPGRLTSTVTACCQLVSRIFCRSYGLSTAVYHLQLRICARSAPCNPSPCDGSSPPPPSAAGRTSAPRPRVGRAVQRHTETSHRRQHTPWLCRQEEGCRRGGAGGGPLYRAEKLHAGASVTQQARCSRHIRTSAQVYNQHQLARMPHSNLGQTERHSPRTCRAAKSTQQELRSEQACQQRQQERRRPGRVDGGRRQGMSLCLQHAKARSLPGSPALQAAQVQCTAGCSCWSLPGASW